MASFMAFESLGLALDMIIVAVPTWLVLTMRAMAFGKRLMMMVVFDVGIIYVFLPTFLTYPTYSPPTLKVMV